MPLVTGSTSERRRIVAFTTDTYVVSPLFFPGGDIGKLVIRYRVYADVGICPAPSTPRM